MDELAGVLEGLRVELTTAEELLVEGAMELLLEEDANELILVEEADEVIFVEEADEVIFVEEAVELVLVEELVLVDEIRVEEDLVEETEHAEGLYLELNVPSRLDLIHVE